MSYQGITTDILNGSFLFSGTFTVPTVQSNSTVSITFPVTMLGNVVAFQDLGGTQGPQMFNLKVAGTGALTLELGFDGQVVATAATVQFDGTANTVPEPSSLAFLVTGLVALAGVTKQRGRRVS